MTFVNNVKAAFDTSADETTRDSGELVSTIIMIAGFAVMALLAVNWLSTAVLNKASDVGSCIEGSNTYSTATVTAAGTTCATNRAATGTNSFTKKSDYTGRMG